MAMTRGAGVFMQVLSIPFIAYGFVGLLATGLAASSTGGLGAAIPYLVAEAVSLLLGFWMLKSGQRAAKMPQL